MFVLSTFEDKVKVKPDLFDQELSDVIEEILEAKYANQTIMNVGLCICFYDFVTIGDPMIYPAEGSAHLTVKFRMVMFKTFIGEIIVGKVLESTPSDIKVSIGFFSNITIPKQFLIEPSSYHVEKNAWAWEYNMDDTIQQFYLPVGEEIRIRVKAVNFTSSSIENEERVGLDANSKAASDMNIDTQRKIGPKSGSPIMQVIAATNDDGLGATAWWNS